MIFQVSCLGFFSLLWVLSPFFFFEGAFLYHHVSLVRNYLILNFLVNKQSQDFHTKLSALTSAVQKHPGSPFAAKDLICISFQIYPLSDGSVLGLTKPSSSASLCVTEMLGEGSMPQIRHRDFVDD